MEKRKISKLVIFNGAILLALYGFYKLKKKKKIENVKINRNYTKIGTLYLDEEKHEQFVSNQEKGRNYTKIKKND